MNLIDVIFICSKSVILPGLAYLVRYKGIEHSDIAILIYSIIAFLNECLQHYLHLRMFVWGNIYVLVESLILYYILSGWVKEWNYSKRTIWISLLISVWLLTSLIDWESRNILFRIGYSFVLVIGAIQVINKLTFSYNSMLNDHRFIFSLGVMFFFSLNMIIESFCIPELAFSKEFILYTFYIKVVSNVIANILFLVSVLCIPKKPKFILSF